MGLEGREASYPFPGARSYMWDPLPPNSFEPKEWQIDAAWAGAGGQLQHPDALFISHGVIVGDPFFIVFTGIGATLATTVEIVNSETVVTLVDKPAIPAQFDTIFKCGEALQHTLQTLMAIIAARAIEQYTMHWRKVWCSARRREFFPDERGDVYIIDPDQKPGGGHFRVNGRDYIAEDTKDWTEEQWKTELEKGMAPWLTE